MEKFTVIGAGNAGCALAAHLKRLGGHVSLYDISEKQLAPITGNNNTITLTGNIDVAGDARIDLITNDIQKAIKDANLIICATPAHVHKAVAKTMAPYLTPEQIILLYPGRTGGVLEFNKILRQHKITETLLIEAQTILYVCRRADATVNIFGTKKEVPCAGLAAQDTNRFFSLTSSLFPQLIPAANIWSTSFENIGMLFHPAPTLLNLGRMESGHPFEYYTEGISPSISEFIEQIDGERLAVASALGVTLPTAVKWLERSYGAKGARLYEALQNNRYYKGVSAPLFASPRDKETCRYIIEDVPTGLVPVSELGKKTGVKTPAIDTLIQLANLMFQANFRESGRNLIQLGIDDLSLEEIKKL